MEQILNQRRATRSEPITMARDMGIYDNSWGAGMYGAFYSPRNTRRPPWQAARENRDRERIEAKKMEDVLESSRDYLQEIKDSLSKTLKEVTRGLLGIKNKEDIHRGKGKLAAEDRDDILRDILQKPNYKTKYQTGREEALLARQQLFQKFSKRGIADTLFGVPQQGSARANGRDYDDALKQYQRDRMMLQGKTLIETYGSKRGAEKQIAKDFAMQQKLAREISITNKEVERRRKAGWADADINSPEAGKFLDKLHDLMDQFAKYDPTNTGRYLERPADKSKAPKDRVLPSERFKVGQAIHKDYRDDDRLKGYKGIPAEKPSDMSEEDKLEAAQQHKQDMEIQEKQAGLLEKIAEALGAKKPEKVPGYSDGIPEAIGFMSALLAPLKFLGQFATSLLTIGKTLITHLGGLAPILTTLGAVLVPLTAAAALLGLGKAQKEKIEANPNAPEFKDNAYAMKLRGEATSVTQATKINQQKALRHLAPGVAKELLDNGPQDENGLIDGYTIDQLQDMAAGKKPQGLSAVPLEKKGKLEAAAIKRVPAASGEKIATQSAANADAKREKASAPVTVVAPSTTNNNVSGGAKEKPMGPVRNQDSSVKRYIEERYLP